MQNAHDFMIFMFFAIKMPVIFMDYVYLAHKLFL